MIAQTKFRNHYISTVKVLDLYFETLVFDNDFDEVEGLRANNLEEAKQNHSKMSTKYCDNKEALALANHLIKANEEALKFSNEDDEGSCNFDSLMINLKGKKKAFIELLQALTGFNIRKSSGNYYFIDLNLKGQAQKRTKMVQEAFNFLRFNNIDCQIYYQLD